MALDPGKIGRVAAELMDMLEAEHGDCELMDVVLCAEVRTPGGMTAYRWKGSAGRVTTDTGIVAQVMQGITAGGPLEP